MSRRQAKKRSGVGRKARAAQPRAEKKPANRMRLVWVAVAAAALVLVLVLVLRDRGNGKSTSGGTDAAAVERLRVEVVRRYPHQRDAFTQGLLWHDGRIYESTGTRGQSSLRMVDLQTGEVVRRRANDLKHFAEGLALVGDLLYQLTWQSGRVLVFRRDDFEPVREHAYTGEGWGLCYDGSELVMSDGSDELTFRDPETFAEKRTIRVTLEGRSVSQLNELECVAGVVWANVWKQDILVRIDPGNGQVTAVVDASGLLTREERRDTDVLNGIASIAGTDRFLLTGKLWPWMFEVRFVR